MFVVEAPPLLLAAEPPGAAFPAGGWRNEVLKEFLLKLTKNKRTGYTSPLLY
ncbi:MAG: hypothetical protein V7L27_12440 [Nostoc sp.]|uniref:hypothetical protein n=1 Tax=Nostoc sp. TaxID=1180 RepID=UPI002FFAE503